MPVRTLAVAAASLALFLLLGAPGDRGSVDGEASGTRHPANARTTYTLLQMNLCLSGIAGCYGRTEYPTVLDEAVQTILDQDADAVTLLEGCRGDALEIAGRTGYHLRFATVVYGGAPLSCVDPGGRGSFGNAVLTREPVSSSAGEPFADQADPEERRWLCATTTEDVSVCAAHLSAQATPAAASVNTAQCVELRAVLARMAGQRVTLFAGDVNRASSCAPTGLWTRTDATARQAPGIQHAYGSSSIADPVAQVLPATYTDHDFLLVSGRLE